MKKCPTSCCHPQSYTYSAKLFTRFVWLVEDRLLWPSRILGSSSVPAVILTVVLLTKKNKTAHLLYHLAPIEVDTLLRLQHWISRLYFFFHIYPIGLIRTSFIFTVQSTLTCAYMYMCVLSHVIEKSKPSILLVIFIRLLFQLFQNCAFFSESFKLKFALKLGANLLHIVQNFVSSDAKNFSC